MELDFKKNSPLKNFTGRLQTIKKQKQWNKGRNNFFNKRHRPFKKREK